ncbi:MAG TPA: hypothetical protein VN658_00500 [Candidatus Acidoferrales bacterium]|nr:hypothetical protein [Candidatus Acidoferrales bacterium]
MCVLRVSSFAQQQQDVCTGTTNPSGWVTIHIKTETNFSNCPNNPNNVKTIEEIDTLVSGASLLACNDGGALPSGWVITDMDDSTGDCIGLPKNVLNLLKVIGDSIGTQHAVCFPNSPIPAGWTNIGTFFNTGLCSGNSPDLATIRRDSGPDLEFSVTPVSQTVAPGGAAQFTLSLVRSGGLSTPVTLSASTPPSGVSIGFSPNNTTAGSSTMTVSTSTGTPMGSFNVQITAVDGVFVRSLVVTVNVQPTGNFAVVASPNPQVLIPGSSNAIDVTLVRSSGFNGSITMSVTGLPSGVTGTFSPGSTFGNTSTLTLTATNAVALGDTSITITGTSGSIVNSTPTTVRTTLLPAWWEAVYQLLTH